MSIQDSSAPDRVSGHLATGVLVDADIVLVPDPPESLVDRAADLEVLIFSTDLRVTTQVDRILTWKWSKFAITGRSATAVTAKLMHHSTYAAQIGQLDGGELASLLDRGLSLWEALQHLRAIPPGSDKIEPELLTRLAEVERRQREPRRADHEFESFAQMVPGFCIFFCFCHPHHDPE